ncbi:POTRA domain-containing protein [Glaesserella parasuis]|uniref:POTRA domain-containing protein n=1 Tax=Glaesserella parasuis TaxID=738 RepID=UPI001F45A289|nr:POTRA domain-containing protein [Glaesserella parasuis]
MDKGYIHNPFQFEDDGSKTLILRVTEGKVAKLTGGSSQVNLAMLFPNIVGQPLNIKELDQGLDQANRLSSNQVSVDVLPAKMARSNSLLSIIPRLLFPVILV